jgi:predicted phage terminase large subunit-like protein
MEISRTKNTENEIVTTRGGYRLAGSLDGALTGRRCDILIIDDPLKRSDAYSASKRKRVNDRFRDTLFSMLEKKKGAIIIAAQRLHVDDLCGSLLSESNDWTRLSLSAVAEKDEQIEIGEGCYYERRKDEPLDAKRESKEDWDAVQSHVGPDAWAAQYQQCPVPAGGAMIKRDRIQRFDQLPIRNASSYVVQSYDTAVRSGGDHDYSVGITILVQDHNYYVMDIFRERVDYPLLRERAKSLAQKYRPNQILIEDSAVGPKLVSDLKAEGLAAVPIRPEGDKVTRMAIQLPKIDDGHLFLAREAPWLAEFEAEFFAFPNAPHDDQVDALSQALAHAQNQSSMWNDTASENFGKFVNGLWNMAEWNRRLGW